MGLACDPSAVERTSTAEATILTSGAAEYTFEIDWRLLPVDGDEDPLVAHTCSLGAVLLPGAADVRALLDRLRERSDGQLRRERAPRRDRHRAGRRRAGRGDGRGRRPGQGERRGPRGALPSPAPCRVGGRPAGAGAGGGRRDSWRRGGPLAGPDGPGRGRLPPGATSPTRLAPETPWAGFLDALWERGRLGAGRREALGALPRAEIAAVLEHAVRAATVTVSRPGADPPCRHEL